MGKTSRFRSESSQFIVIATVMLCLLATSLGVAHRLSRRPPMQDVAVGGLKLRLPESWQPLGNHPRSPALDAEKVLIDTADPSRRLLLGRLIPNAPHTAWESLDIVRRTTLDFQDLSTFHVHESKRYHSGHRFTHTFMASSQSETGVVVHQFAFITEDARTYWLIHLRVADDGAPADESQVRSDVRLMSMLTSQAQNTAWRNAKSADYRAAGIEVRDNVAMPPGIHARVRVDGSPGDPVLIVPGSNRLGVVAAHIRGVVDVTGTSSDDPSSPDMTPEHLLAGRFHREMGRELRDEESWSGEITPEGGHVALSAWSVRFEGEPVHPQLQPLMRQLFYVRTALPGRAMLIELVHESPGAKDIRSWVGTIVAALSRQLEVDDEHGDRAAASAAECIAAGRHIAAEGRASLATALRDGSNYFQIARRGRPFGFQAERIVRGTGAEAWIQGRSLAILGDTSGFPIRYTWEVHPAGSGMRITTTGGSAQSQSSFEIQVALEDRTLKLIRPEQDAWAVDVPDGYLLPIVEDHWPIQSMDKMERAEALVWRSFHRYPPEPWLLKWRRLPQGDPSGAAWELCFRPLMALDEDRIFLDEDGAVLEFQGWERNTRHTGAVRIGVVRVSRDKLTRSHPDWMESLRNWEQDWNQQ